MNAGVDQKADCKERENIQFHGETVAVAMRAIHQARPTGEDSSQRFCM